MNYETYEARQAREKFETFLANIDDSVAGADEYGGLRWHIECSALANCEGILDAEAAWGMAYDTAVMILDCWEDYYPQLVKETR